MTLGREWTKYMYGVYSETGYPDDVMYPLQYSLGNQTKPNQACSTQADEMFCSTEDYDSTGTDHITINKYVF